jgi:hypothetical protein
MSQLCVVINMEVLSLPYSPQDSVAIEASKVTPAYSLETIDTHSPTLTSMSIPPAKPGVWRNLLRCHSLHPVRFEACEIPGGPFAVAFVNSGARRCCIPNKVKVLRQIRSKDGDQILQSCAVAVSYLHLHSVDVFFKSGDDPRRPRKVDKQLTATERRGRHP